MSSLPIIIPVPGSFTVEGLVDIHSTPLTHSSRTSMLPSTKLYVPVHKRPSSSSSFSSSASSTFFSSVSPETSSSSRATSPTPSSASPGPDDDEQEEEKEDRPVDVPTRSLPPFVYSPAELLSLATSDLSRISPETRNAMRRNVPEIVMNRQQRKSVAYKAAQGGATAVPVTIVSKHFTFGFGKQHPGGDGTFVGKNAQGEMWEDVYF